MSFLLGLAVCFLVFLGGVFAAYSYFLPAALESFEHDRNTMVFIMWTWRAYFAYAAQLCFHVGILGELPAVLILLGMLDFVGFRTLSRIRFYAYAIILALAALFASTLDAMILFFTALPFVLAYEAGTWAVWFFDRWKIEAELLAAKVSG